MNKRLMNNRTNKLNNLITGTDSSSVRNAIPQYKVRIPAVIDNKSTMLFSSFLYGFILCWILNMNTRNTIVYLKDLPIEEIILYVGLKVDKNTFRPSTTVFLIVLTISQ